jgi:hypothetical protein
VNSARCILVLLMLIVIAVSLFVAAQTSTRQPSQNHTASEASVPTEIRVESEPWWPTAGHAKRNEYVGSQACASCHAEKFATQIKTSMGRAAARTVDSEQLRQHSDLTTKFGIYTSQFAIKDGRSTLSVSDGTQSTTKDLLWAVGDGRFGQTYLYSDKAGFYESQLSFYTREKALDMTTGHMEPRTLETAAGGLTTSTMIRQCFGCHFTASTTEDQFHPDEATPGLGCEACHGPGLQHVVLHTVQGDDTRGGAQLVMNPARLKPAESVDFCGACHRTTADAELQGLAKAGINNVRLQPYRLQKSKCWGKGDARITCMACHDPHVQVVEDAAAYDSKCLACHAKKTDGKASVAHAAPACPTGTKNCVTCHMQKLEVPGTHAVFTDHWIRVVKAGEKYPE